MYSLCGGIAAFIAAIGLLPCVDSAVQCEAALLAERLFATLTGVRFLL